MSTITGNIPLPTTSGASARRTRRRIVIFLLVSFLAFGAISVSAWFLVFGAVSISIHPGEDDKKREKPSEALKVPSQPPIGGERSPRDARFLRNAKFSTPRLPLSRGHPITLR